MEIDTYEDCIDIYYFEEETDEEYLKRLQDEYNTYDYRKKKSIEDLEECVQNMKTLQDEIDKFKRG